MSEAKADNLVPVFPLPNTVLLPSSILPLHIFEPRYRSMVADVMAKPLGSRHLAIALLDDDYEELYQTNHAPIRPIVCVGEIIQHLPLPDGCCNILTLGRARAKVVREELSAAYRRARLQWMPTEPRDFLAAVHEHVDAVRRALKQFAEFELCQHELATQILRCAPSAAALIDMAAFHLLGSEDVVIKQRILEETQLEVRAEILAMRLSSVIDEHRTVGVADRGPCWPPVPESN